VQNTLKNLLNNQLANQASNQLDGWLWSRDVHHPKKELE
jgi:hypothetical protein